jgi:hypothetical protein
MRNRPNPSPSEPPEDLDPQYGDWLMIVGLIAALALIVSSSKQNQQSAQYQIHTHPSVALILQSSGQDRRSP